MMKKTKPQCGLIIENAEGKILLQLRDDKPDIPYPNSRGTFGRQVEDGETQEQAITREIKEELDYDLKHPEFYGNYPFDGYDIYMFRKTDNSIKPENLSLKEGRMANFFSRGDSSGVKCALNCREIVEDYFQKFH
jgi:8-oxo-dGTP diphosphatase